MIVTIHTDALFGIVPPDGRDGLGYVRTVHVRIDRSESDRLESYVRRYVDAMRARYRIEKKHAAAGPRRRHVKLSELLPVLIRRDPTVRATWRPDVPEWADFVRCNTAERCAVIRGLLALIRRRQLHLLDHDRIRWFWLECDQWRATPEGLMLRPVDRFRPVRVDDSRWTRLWNQLIRVPLLVFCRDNAWYASVLVPYAEVNAYDPSSVIGVSLHQDGLLIDSLGRVYEPGWLRKRRVERANWYPPISRRGTSAYRHFLRYGTAHTVNRFVKTVLREGLCVALMGIEPLAVAAVDRPPRHRQATRAARPGPDDLWYVRIDHPFLRNSTARAAGLFPWNFTQLYRMLTARLNQAGVFWQPMPKYWARAADRSLGDTTVINCLCGHPFTFRALYRSRHCPHCKRRIDRRVAHAYLIGYVDVHLNEMYERSWPGGGAADRLLYAIERIFLDPHGLEP